MEHFLNYFNGQLAKASSANRGSFVFGLGKGFATFNLICLTIHLSRDATSGGGLVCWGDIPDYAWHTCYVGGGFRLPAALSGCSDVGSDHDYGPVMPFYRSAYIMQTKLCVH